MKIIELNLIIIFIPIIYPLKEIKCPPHCICDIFQQYRRASCQNRRLVSVEADVPNQVQLLDLSHNLIHELQDHIFVDLEFTKLNLLNLSHNKINKIHMNAFLNMDTLKTIDLSYNNIEYVLEHWFWNTPNLKELYLGGNNLRMLKDGPLIDTSPLKILDLSSCSLLNIPEDSFSKLQHLEVLDVSKNNLIQLTTKVIEPCVSLKILKIESNNLHCNNITGNLINYCIRNGIRVKNPCAKSPPGVNKEVKFERIIILDKGSEEARRNSWIYDDKEISIEHIPDKEMNLNVCATVTHKGVLLDVIELSPILVVITIFSVGLGLGLVIACGLSGKSPKKIKLERTRRLSDIYVSFTNDYEVSETTPMPVRRSIQY